VDKDRIEQLKESAALPARQAPMLHRRYHGKIGVSLKCPVSRVEDFGIWYTPGVAAPCLEIAQERSKVFEYTNRANSIAVVSDGSRVLGLGDIGPEAGLPVMEGKALLFKHLGGIDAFPIMLDAHEPDEIVQAVKWIAPGFGGINLEDIATPKCFAILDRLRAELDIPVWHDDQQGTAAVVLAGILNALKIVGKSLSSAAFCILGVGAANSALIRFLRHVGVPPGNMILVDRVGILNPERADLEEKKKSDPRKWQLAVETNGERRSGGPREALAGVDVLVAASQPGPGTIRGEWLREMNRDAVAFLLANPTPELWPWEAEKAGMRIVATGRSDFANQVNNSIGFPGIFRGALDVRAKTISDDMAIAGAHAIAQAAEEQGIREDRIVPTMMETDVFVDVAVAVGQTAIQQGIARQMLTEDQIRESAITKIQAAKEQSKVLASSGLIAPLPPHVP